MAWATKCDRCGGYFEHCQDKINGFAFLTYNRPKDKYFTDGNEYDLCPSCVHSLDVWFESRKDGDAHDG